MALRTLPNLSDLAFRALPRVAHLADTPSLMALALLAQGVSALLPESFRGNRESLT